MEVDLPVWTIRPNWRQGVNERLEWLTDILGSSVGAEQRRAVRQSPRRSFEITVNPTHRERTYLDLLLHRLGSTQWYFPLWHDQAILTQRAVVGAQALMFDNAFREHRDGDYALLYMDCFNYEVVQVQQSWEGGLILSNDVEREWPLGTKVYALRQGYLDAETSLAALTSRVGESTLRFTINDSNDFDAATDAELTLFEGSPVLTIEPNRVRPIDTTHTRLTTQADGQVGLIRRVDSAGRAFAVQSHNWMVRGREQQAAFRRFLYRLRGRQRMVWLPTFNDDVTLARPVAVGAVQARIGHIGLRTISGSSPIPGRATLWTGREVLRIAAHMAPQAPEEDRLSLATPAGFAYPAGASWPFLQAARMDQDAVELQHYTDSDGVFECSATFRSFANIRDASGSNFPPIPITPKLPGACGVGEDNPCDVVFPGWFWKIGLRWSQPANEGQYPNIYSASLPQSTGVFPNGGFMPAGSPFNRGNIVVNNGIALRDVPGGFDVTDGPNGATIMMFRWQGEPRVTGYEWTFFFPITPGNRASYWSHQFAFDGINGQHPASQYARRWDSPVEYIEAGIVRSLFPVGYGIAY